MKALGTHLYRMDGKGRVVVPRDFQRMLGEPMIGFLLPGSGPEKGGVVLVSRAEWQRVFGSARRERPWLRASAAILSADDTTGRVQFPAVWRELLALAPGSRVALVALNRGVMAMRESAWRAWVGGRQ